MKTIGLLLVVVCSGVQLAADVVIKEITGAKVGGRVLQGTRTTYIKGAQMRIELVQAGESRTTLFDVPGGDTIVLDAKKKRAEMRAIDARNAELEREYPRARVTLTMTPTGGVRQLVGASCAEHAFTVRVPLFKDDTAALVVTGSAWIATGVPGAEDYAAFVRAAIDRHVVLGPASNNKIMLALIRAQTELYRALGGLHGIPYLIDMATTIEGKGMLASMVRKLVSGTQASTVTAVTTPPLADTMFAVPAGWKRERQ